MATTSITWISLSNTDHAMLRGGIKTVCGTFVPFDGQIRPALGRSTCLSCLLATEKN